MSKQNLQLIDQLAGDLKPVRAVPLTLWIGLWSLLACIIGLWYFRNYGIREDISEKMQEMSYAVASVIFGLATFISGWLCFSSAIPGMMTKRQHSKAIFTLLTFAGVAVIAYSGMMSSLPEFSRSFVAHDAIGCCMRITKGLVVPAVLLLAITSRLAPTRTWATTWYAVGAGTLLTSFVSQLNCPIDNPWHVLVGHGAMVAVTAGVALWVLGFVFRLVLRASR